MVRDLLIRGMLAGILAGLLATLFAYVFGEPSVDWAIGFEDHAARMAGEAEEAALVSRGIQSTVGLLTGITVVGVALGGVFGIAYAFALGRLGRLSPAATALVLALVGFVVVALVPQLKYPANPPSVGSPDTIGVRTGLYFALLGLSVVSASLALALGRTIAARSGSWTGLLAGATFYAALIGVVMAAMPRIDEAPEGFPDTVLWAFRLASIGTGVVLWGTLGIAFGLLAAWRPLAARRRSA